MPSVVIVGLYEQLSCLPPFMVEKMCGRSVQLHAFSMFFSSVNVFSLQLLLSPKLSSRPRFHVAP